MADGIDLAIESLKERLSEIKQLISQCRKKGYDTKIAELKILIIPSKIKMVEATRDIKDVQKASKYLGDANSEIEEVARLAAEKQETAKEYDILEDMNEILRKIEASINDRNFSEARQFYQKGINIYKDLPQESKNEVYARLSELRSELIKV